MNWENSKFQSCKLAANYKEKSFIEQPPPGIALVVVPRKSELTYETRFIEAAAVAIDCARINPTNSFLINKLLHLKRILVSWLI